MVRLEHVGNITTVPAILMFQSHYGAIRTISNLKNWMEIIRFNPTMVRLERRELSGGFISISRSFNPTMVRLELWTFIHDKNGKPSFNPTMVRLERRDSQGFCSSQKRFNPTMVRLEQV